METKKCLSDQHCRQIQGDVLAYLGSRHPAATFVRSFALSFEGTAGGVELPYARRDPAYAK